MLLALLHYHMSNMEHAWYQGVLDRLLARCLVDEVTGCMFWQGALWSGSRYGMCWHKPPGQQRKRWRVHRLVYALHLALENNSPDLTLPTHNNHQEPIEISHLCHSPLCLNINHLTLETHSTNMDRELCRHQGFCTANHQPPCLI